MYENYEDCIAFMISLVRMSIFMIIYELIQWVGVIMINFMMFWDCLIFLMINQVSYILRLCMRSDIWLVSILRVLDISLQDVDVRATDIALGWSL